MIQNINPQIIAALRNSPSHRLPPRRGISQKAISPNIREGMKTTMKKKLPHHCGESNLVGQGHRKTGKYPMRLTQQDKYNGSGCLDMTAYLAMRNIERRGG